MSNSDNGTNRRVGRSELTPIERLAKFIKVLRKASRFVLTNEQLMTIIEHEWVEYDEDSGAYIVGDLVDHEMRVRLCDAERFRLVTTVVRVGTWYEDGSEDSVTQTGNWVVGAGIFGSRLERGTESSQSQSLVTAPQFKEDEVQVVAVREVLINSHDYKQGQPGYYEENWFLYLYVPEAMLPADDR